MERERDMTCYLIAQINVHDREGYRKYLEGFDEVFKDYDGAILAADKEPVVLEGEWPYQRTVLMSFRDMEEAQRWYNSPQYQALAKQRQGASDSNIVLVRGME
jgi:uncharacterized protein (DUF1330 family)